MEELKDIKDIVEVQEYSLLMLIGLVIIALLLLSLAVYFFKNRRRRRKKPSGKELALEKLKNIDYKNTKETVYTFEEQIRDFLDEKNQEEFDAIHKELEVYKYKREIPALDTNIEKRIKTFIGAVKC